MQLVTQAMLQRFAKAQPVDGAWAVLVDLGGGGLPASEAAFAEPFDDLAQPGNDGVTFIVTGAAAFIQPRVEAYTGCRGSGAVSQPVMPSAVASSPAAAARPNRRAARWA